MKKRLFIAIKIELNERNRKFIKNLKSKFGNEKIKWVEFDNIHLTLKFLGETDVNLIPSIKNALKNVVAKFPEFSINLKGLGIFKNFSNPRVLWIGLEKSEILKEIFNEIENSMELIGFKKENRDFNPHVTLARIKRINNLKAFVKLILDEAKKEFQEIKVKELILMESILRKEGPKYIELEKFALLQNS